jgi:4-amino-4-deoxy-L-arabinose transferase-like glycosyltransferase
MALSRLAGDAKVTDRRLAVIWVCAVVRLGFYAAMLPLWEGFDEWGHFAVIRSVASGQALPSRAAALQPDIESSLQQAPVPWEMRNMPAPFATQDAYWAFSAEQRQDREIAFARRSAAPNLVAMTQYEALQAPLYYWLMAPVMWLLGGLGLAVQVMVLRWLSVLIAACTIPLIYAIGREIFDDLELALGCAAVTALMPEFALDVARVANDCLAVPLFTLVIYLGLRILRLGLSYRRAAWLGLALGAGLLTKAYFLSALPGVAVLLAHEVWRGQKKLPPALLAGAASVAVAGWWYARNLFTTGTLAGLSEAVQLRQTGWLATLQAAARISWPKAIDSVLLSHIYFGAWSSMTVRSWIYHLLYGVALAGVIGLAREIRRPGIWWLLIVYIGFWVGQSYNIVLLFLAKGVPTSMGWYLYAVVGAEVTLCVAGLQRWIGRWAILLGTVLFALLDLYTVNVVAMPYYTGMIRHRANGTLEAMQIAKLGGLGLDGVFGRLAIYKAPLVLPSIVAALWVAYVSATVWLAVASAGRSPNSCATQSISSPPPKPV